MKRCTLLIVVLLTLALTCACDILKQQNNEIENNGIDNKETSALTDENIKNDTEDTIDDVYDTKIAEPAIEETEYAEETTHGGDFDEFPFYVGQSYADIVRITGRDGTALTEIYNSSTNFCCSWHLKEEGFMLIVEFGLDNMVGFRATKIMVQHGNVLLTEETVRETADAIFLQQFGFDDLSLFEVELHVEWMEIEAELNYWAIPNDTDLSVEVRYILTVCGVPTHETYSVFLSSSLENIKLGSNDRGALSKYLSEEFYTNVEKAKRKIVAAGDEYGAYPILSFGFDSEMKNLCLKGEIISPPQEGESGESRHIFFSEVICPVIN